MSNLPLTAVSLFASGGVGDLALRAAGFRTLIANELQADRASLFKRNYPDAEVVVGDIWVVLPDIIRRARAALRGEALDCLFATPPCQGMSKNGRGKLLQGVREGRRAKLDPRNQLILPTVSAVEALLPRMFVIENVPELETTLIESPDGQLMGALEYVDLRLERLGYVGQRRIVEFADLGVPQRRQRLIAIYAREAHITRQIRALRVFPTATHSRAPTLLQKKWVSVDDAISHLPKLDASSADRASSGLEFHRVPVLDSKKYFWVSNTPEGRGAFDNQCVNDLCRYSSNPVHGTNRNAAGINRANATTPIRCVMCNELLPRPWVERDGEFRLMSGFTSAYKRMSGDLPASALTRNLSYACSDQKLHPRQHRVLSLLEAMIIHTISQYDYDWHTDGNKPASDKLIREVIGESIPPAGLEVIFQHLRAADLEIQNAA